MAAWPLFADPLDSAWNWPRELQQLGSADLFFWIRDGDARRREWTITRQDTVIGYLSVREIDPGERSSRLGIGLGAPYVGQGYGSEALRAFMDLYFGAFEFRLLRLAVTGHNLRARRCYERLGFRERARRWQDEGAVESFAFLSSPRYDALREQFDRRHGRMFGQIIEMELRNDTHV